MKTTWAVLLAGGDGSRLRGEPIGGIPIDRPKQFLALDGGTSLLGSTLKRAFRLAHPSHVVAVVASAHRSWWAEELRDILSENILVQPLNRGTAPALLLATVHILNKDPDATILFLPSDHGVEDELILSRTLSAALRFVEEQPDSIVLIGVTPTHPETEYGWIVPEGRSQCVAQPVRHFVEKPSHESAAHLMEQGALWNTFMLAASGTAFLDRFLQAAPDFARRYLCHLSHNGWTEAGLSRFYHTLRHRDFSRDLLAASPSGLGVMSLPPCGWTDLGNPRRVAAWLTRQQATTDLAVAS